MNSQMNMMHKTSIHEIEKELVSCVLLYDWLCLSKTEKWCSEMLHAIESVNVSPDMLKVDYSEIIEVKEFTKFQIARSYFNNKEYLRASFYLADSSSSAAYFLYVYSKYMAIMKKSVDNKSDLLNNLDPICLESLQSLRTELSSRYFNLDPYSLYIYGLVLSKLKLSDDAINAFIESVKKKPSLWCSWTELAKLTRTLENLNKVNQSGLPQHWMKDLYLAQCYMELSLSEEAVAIYSTYCMKGFSKSIYIRSQMGKCFDNMREGQECKQTFEYIRRLDPYNLDFMDIYSNILFVLEEHAQLAILAQEACEIDKYRPESCCIIGNYYSLQNEHYKAVNYFQRALKLNPSYLQAWTLMGHEFMELKNSTSAIQSYTNAIELNPKDYRAWYGLGQTYEILKLYSYSLYYYKQAYLLRTNDSRFIVALGDVYAKLEKWDEAKRLYIRAYSVGDHEGTSLCKLAKVYEKLNEPLNVAIAYSQFTEDQKIIRRVNSTSDLSQAHKYLANFYLKKMNLDKAYESASRCLEFPETRQEAQSILNQIAQARNAMREPPQVDATPLITISNAGGIDMDLANDVASGNEIGGNGGGGINTLRINDNNNEQRSLILSPSLINFENSDSNINPNGGGGGGISFTNQQSEQMTTGGGGSEASAVSELIAQQTPSSSSNLLGEATAAAAAASRAASAALAAAVNSDDSESESAFNNAIRKRFPNNLRRDLN